MAPKVSTAGSFLTIALCVAIVWVPNAKIIVTIAGNPSGMAATARETATKNISITNLSVGSVPRLVIKPTTKTIAQIAKIIIVKILPSWFRFCFRGVSVSSVLLSMVAILPTSVCIPVPITIPSPRP